GKEAGQFLKSQENFLENFLRRWAPLFCTRIKEGTPNEFYAALADCLGTLVQEPIIRSPSPIGARNHHLHLLSPLTLPSPPNRDCVVTRAGGHE
ncbi:MAG: hypothetical protein ABH969_11660, partial [Pseudomonadota bacterium]